MGKAPSNANADVSSPARDLHFSLKSSSTVNSKIFARVLFLRNFAYANFMKIKSSRNHYVFY